MLTDPMRFPQVTKLARIKSGNEAQAGLTRAARSSDHEEIVRKSATLPFESIINIARSALWLLPGIFLWLSIPKSVFVRKIKCLKRRCEIKTDSKQVSSEICAGGKNPFQSQCDSMFPDGSIRWASGDQGLEVGAKSSEFPRTFQSEIGFQASVMY